MRSTGADHRCKRLGPSDCRRNWPGSPHARRIPSALLPSTAAPLSLSEAGNLAFVIRRVGGRCPFNGRLQFSYFSNGADVPSRWQAFDLVVERRTAEVGWITTPQLESVVGT